MNIVFIALVFLVQGLIFGGILGIVPAFIFLMIYSISAKTEIQSEFDRNTRIPILIGIFILLPILCRYLSLRM